MDEMKAKYDRLKEERKKLVAEIHELKCKMTEIRSQEDDILRELEMEKALIKGEYDSEIAILNIEQRKKAELVEQAKKIEEEIKQLKEKQEARQNDMRDRVDIATMKVERLVPFTSPRYKFFTVIMYRQPLGEKGLGDREPEDDELTGRPLGGQTTSLGWVTIKTRTNVYQECQHIQKIYKDSALTQLDQELDITLNEIAKKKPLSPQKALPTESDSEQEGKPKRQHMAKVSKFELLRETAEDRKEPILYVQR
ncbi:uncharacterized protein [Choristoneura fumiferana]|uniref:uncharacterized protein n=1 Tax=Choristoneura fumiferana TaxID=7141 RepID=UPI003D1594E9